MNLFDVFLQVNDVVVTGDDTLVSCSSDTTLKVLFFSAQEVSSCSLYPARVLGLGVRQKVMRFLEVGTEHYVLTLIF